jgi:hypothetical protein
MSDEFHLVARTEQWDEIRTCFTPGSDHGGKETRVSESVPLELIQAAIVIKEGLAAVFRRLPSLRRWALQVQ